MAYTLITSVNCNRGEITTLLSGVLGSRAYVIQVDPFPFPSVQYRGTLFQELDDTLALNIPFELISSTQCYRPNTRVTTPGFGGNNVGLFKYWLPGNFRFSFAIVNVYLIS
jgi:hypothetical protein